MLKRKDNICLKIQLNETTEANSRLMTTEVEEPFSPSEENLEVHQQSQLPNSSLQNNQPENFQAQDLKNKQIQEQIRENRQKKCRRGVRIFYLTIFVALGIIFPISFTLSNFSQEHIHFKTTQGLSLFISQCQVSLKKENNLKKDEGILQFKMPGKNYKFDKIEDENGEYYNISISNSMNIQQACIIEILLHHEHLITAN